MKSLSIFLFGMAISFQCAFAAQTRTYSDTLTIQKGIERHVPLYPGFDDENVGKVKFVGGSIYMAAPKFTNENYARYFQADSYDDPTDFGAYAVAINGIEDAFAMDYILVKFVESLEIPTIDPESLPDSIRVGETFTVSLQGDIDLMTSWMPTLESSNSNIELVSVSKSSATFKAVARGNVSITLSHKNALRQDIDETTTVDVEITDPIGSVEMILAAGSTLKLTPNPAETTTYLSFNLKQPQSNITIKLIDLQGKTHSEYKIQGKTINHPLNIESLPTGSYLLQIQIEQYHQTIPLIKTPKNQ